jgi:hypothetical protein
MDTRTAFGVAMMLAIAAPLAGCRSNNLLLGRVEATVGDHKVVVTDCYRTSVPPPETTSESGSTVYRFTPCRDAEVTIRRETLIVNGGNYGMLEPGDVITVDHGRVLINDRPGTTR